MKKNFFASALLLSAFITTAYAQNVGVDVASPAEKLDVLGAIRIGTTTNTNAGTIRWTGSNFEGYNGSAWINLGGGGTVTGTGTPTRLAFWSGTSSLSSNANLFWDNTNSRLGVGLTNPLGVVSAGSTFGNKVLAYDDGTNASGLGIQAGALQMFTSNNTSNIVFGYGSSGAFTENVRFTGTGRVGIGTNSPSLAKLQVEGVVGNTVGLFRANSTSRGMALVADWPGLYFNSYYDGTNFTAMAGSGYSAMINGNQTSGGFDFIVVPTANTVAGANITPLLVNAMNITGTGNIGMGTATPGAKLEVAGQVKITGGTPGANKVLTSDAAGLATWVDPTTLGIDATTASNGLTEVGNDIRLGGTLTANTTVTQAANTLAFTSTATNGFSVDGTTLSVDAANNKVGIGTNAPSAKMDVQVSGGAEGLRVTGSATQSGLNPVASFWGDLGASPDMFDKSVNIVNNGASGHLVRLQLTDAAPGMCLSQIESAYNGGLPYLAFRTSTGVGNITEKMRVTAAGNVGIGSTAPGAKLDVNGQVKITGGTPGLNQVLTSDAAGLATWEPAQGDDLGNHIATQNIQLNNNWLSNDGGSEGIRVDNNGNVGVGQTPSSAYLDITGTNAGTTSLQLRSGNSGSGTASNQVTMGFNGTENYRHAIKTRHNSGGNADNAIDFYLWKFGTDAAATVGTQQVMSIDGGNGGSVGIGTTTPGAQLHTTGSVRLAGLTSATQTSAVMADGSGNLSTRTLDAVAFTGDLASGDGDYIQNQSVGSNFATGQNASFDIQSNAEIGGTLTVNNNVGIGTATPGNPLEIVKAGGNSAMFRNTNSTNYSGIRFYNDQNVNVRALEIDYSGSAYPIALMNSGVIGESGSIATTGAYPLQIGTNNTLRIMIKGDGNVGIGTSTPQTTFHINSTDAAILPSGSTAQRPAITVAGGVRFNSTLNTLEYYDGVTWIAVGNPTGTVITYAASTTVPAGYLECNGAAVSRTTYAALFTIMGTKYGVGDGSTTFNLPDYRGYFLRGWNNGSGNDPDAAGRTNRGDGTTGDNLGTKQVDGFKSHTHSYVTPQNYDDVIGGSGTSARIQTTGTTGATGGNETRPKNINVMYCIKY